MSVDKRLDQARASASEARSRVASLLGEPNEETRTLVELARGIDATVARGLPMHPDVRGLVMLIREAIGMLLDRRGAKP